MLLNIGIFNSAPLSGLLVYFISNLNKLSGLGASHDYGIKNCSARSRVAWVKCFRVANGRVNVQHGLIQTRVTRTCGLRAACIRASGRGAGIMTVKNRSLSFAIQRRWRICRVRRTKKRRSIFPLFASAKVSSRNIGATAARCAATRWRRIAIRRFGIGDGHAACGG